MAEKNIDARRLTKEERKQINSEIVEGVADSIAPDNEGEASEKSDAFQKHSKMNILEKHSKMNVKKS